MRDALDDELSPCVGEKMRDIAQGFRQRPTYLELPPRLDRLPIRKKRGPAKRCNRVDAWAFYDWARKQSKVPSFNEISAYLGVSLMTARSWRNDFLNYYTPDKRTMK